MFLYDNGDLGRLGGLILWNIMGLPILEATRLSSSYGARPDPVLSTPLSDIFLRAVRDACAHSAYP